MINWTGGNILDAETDYIAQGVAVGSQEGLGTGLALKISTKWPEAQKQFKKFTRNNKFEAGDIFLAKGEPGIIYIATQPDMYHAELSYLNRGLKNLAGFCVKNKIGSVALPKIGAGLGKLDWETEVKPLIVRHLYDQETVFMVYEDFKNEYES
jgi:O-acetyl-ADP-ribose deacetylase (regulator of RNase III)